MVPLNWHYHSLNIHFTKLVDLEKGSKVNENAENKSGLNLVRNYFGSVLTRTFSHFITSLRGITLNTINARLALSFFLYARRQINQPSKCNFIAT
jgi:hypothetical protein